MRAKAADPNTPAVVRVPPPILASDTARKEVEPVVTTDAARMTLSRNYALLGAGLSFIDPKLLAAAYAPAAELTTPNGKFTGQAAILKEYQSFGMDGSVMELQRQSAVLKVVDSTVADSDTYTVVRKRDRADSTVESGVYVRLADPVPADGMGHDAGSPVSCDEEETIARSIRTTAFAPPSSSRTPTLRNPSRS